MSCSPILLNDYLLKELPDPERRKLEVHLKTCAVCREELERLRLTENALFSLRDEEVPQRIAFVSDPVFEASAWRKWWSGFWSAPARLGFASAALLSGAILFSAVTRPAPVAVPVKVVTAAPASLQTTAAAVPEAEIERRVQLAVEKALNANQDREETRVRELVSQVEQARQQLKTASAELDWSERHADMARAASYGPPVQTAMGGLK